MTTAVSTMIVNSLIANGEKRIGDTLTAVEQTYYLGKLNSMVESWSLNRSLCYQILQENFALTVSTGTYSIGTGATFNTARPNKIISAFVRDSANADSNVKVIPYDAYDSITLKSVAASYPRYLYYDQGYDSSGFGTIKISPFPIAGLTLYFDSAKQLQSFASVSTALLMPPGYQRAIESNFTIETAPGLKSVQPEVIRIARESKAALIGNNVTDPISRLDVGMVGYRASSIIEGP